MSKHQNSGRKIIATNRKAQSDYHLLDTYDAGLVLVGSEIKSLRAGRVNLRDGFVQEQGGELWLMNVHIASYDQASVFGHTDPLRPRKLLLHKKEINRLMGQVRQKGYTIIPTRIYLERGWAKAEIALAKGKKQYDKRDTIAQRDANREIRRALKEQ